MMLFLCTLAWAGNNMSAGDEAYRQGDYQKALSVYEKALKDEGLSSAVYCAIGNSHYRMGNYPQAMVAYQRAQKVSPTDADIQHNIEMTINKTIDRLPVNSDVFFVQWYKGLVSSLTIDAWGYVAMVTLVVALVLFLCYLFMDAVAVRRASFYGAIAMFLVCLLGNLFAWQQKHTLLSHDAAVVIVGNAKVKTSPTEKSGDAFILHEGTCVTITDDEINGWYAITLPDGRKGWMPSKNVELI